MITWKDTRHPLDICQQLPPVEAYEQQFYEPYVAVSRYDGPIMLALMLACSAVWFAGTWMIIVFLIGG